MIRNDQPVSEAAWPAQKVKALLKILLTQRSSVSEEQLLEWLWPESRPTAAASALRSTTSRLRRILEPDLGRYQASSYILVKDGRYTFQPAAETWIDVDHFVAGYRRGLALLDEARPDEAADAFRAARMLYQGDYLAEDRYDDWAIVLREHLREQYFLLLTRLADIYTQQRHFRRAAALCREVLAVEPLREEAWRQLMRCHFLAGDRALALRAYKACRLVLGEELGVEPAAETTALYRQIEREPAMHTAALIARQAHIRQRPLALGRLPFVGREAELITLLDHVEQVTQGQGRMILVEGNAGVGKTRLVEEVLLVARQQGTAQQGMAQQSTAQQGTAQQGMAQQSTAQQGVAQQGVAQQGVAQQGVAQQGVAQQGVAQQGVAQQGVAQQGVAQQGVAQQGVAQQGVVILSGRCQQFAGRQPYQPIREGLQGILETEPLRFTGIRSEWLAVVADLLPGLRQTLPHLPHLPPLPPEQEKARRNEALTGFLTTWVEQAGKGLLLFVDDLHWADSATLEFLEQLLNELAQRPILLLVTARSEETVAAEGEGLARLLLAARRRGLLFRRPLAPLAHEDVRQLLRMLDGRPPAPTSSIPDDPLSHHLYQETAGYPLYLLTLLQVYFDEGVLAHDEQGHWVQPAAISRAAHVPAAPAMLTQMWLRRVHPLGPEPRQVLEAAAVLGREFEWSALRQMRTWRGDVLFDHLDQLISLALIREQPNERYFFTHDKIHEVTYEAIPPDRRHWLHGRAGEALETTRASRLDEAAGALADHYHLAALPESEFPWRMRAGEYAARFYADAEAQTHYQAALALITGGALESGNEQRSELYERLADLDEAGGLYEPALKKLEQAVPLAATAAQRLRLLYKQAHNHDRRGHSGPARELLYQAFREASWPVAGEDDEVSSLEAARITARWAIMGFLNYHDGSTAAHYARRAVDLLARYLPHVLDPQATLTWFEYAAAHDVLCNGGEALRYSGYREEALDLFQKSLLVAERQQDFSGIGFSSHNSGDVLLAEGDFGGARAAYERAAASFARAGQPWPEMASATHLGLTWACAGDWAEALAVLEQARDAGERMEPTQWLSEVYLWLAVATLLADGERTLSTSYRQQATAVAQAAGQQLPADIQHAADAVAADAVAADAAGHTAEAWTHYHELERAWSPLGRRAIYQHWLLPRLRPRVEDSRQWAVGSGQ